MRAVVYARLSRRTDTNAPNLDDQLKRCREHAAKRGWTIVAEHREYGESAYAGVEDAADRPGYADLLDDVKRRRCDAILAWRPDRLWRDPIECALLMRQCVRHGVQLVATVTEGDRDPANPGDEMVATIVAAVGRYESAAKSARSRAKQRQIAETGRPIGGGRRAYGYASKDRQTVDEHEAAVVTAVAGNVLAGATLYSQVAELEQRGEVTVTGKPWTVARLGDLLRSPHLAGQRVHRGRIVGPATWPAILPVDHWLALQDVLTDANHRYYGPGREYLLTRGIAVCGLCEAPLVSQPVNDGRRAYACSVGPGLAGCGRIRRLAEPLEGDVIARFWKAVDDGALVDATPPATGVTLAEVNAAETKLTSLARDHYVLNLIGRDEYLAARPPLADEAERLRRELAAGSAPPDLSIAQLRRRWDALTTGQRREELRRYVEAVVLHSCLPGRTRYDPDRVEMRWRPQGAT